MFHKINSDRKVFIVAEISANHNKNFNKAVSMIRVAHKCGADAVKFQTYTPDTITIDSNNKYFNIKHHKWGGQTLYQLYQKAYTPWDWFKKLKKVADDLGMIMFSTAFDKTAVDFLEDLNVPFHKIASFELVDLPLIEYMAKTKKPLILSTGMATFQEIQEAITTAKKAGAKDIVLLKCVSSYPAKPQEMNLRTIPDMKTRFKVPIGLSDHSMGVEVAIAAVSLGAVMVEKHFTLARSMASPDNFFSIEPKEFKTLVDSIRITELALGKVNYSLTPGEALSRTHRRSLFVVEDVKKGATLTDKNIKSIRPANGLKPKFLKAVIGKKAKKDVKKGTPLAWPLIA